MALVLKTGKTFAPKGPAKQGLALSLSDCYGVVDFIEYKKDERHCVFLFDVYASAAARSDKKAVVDRYTFSFSNDIFEALIGNNGFTVTDAYTYLSNLSDLEDWQSDE